MVISKESAANKFHDAPVAPIIPEIAIATVTLSLLSMKSHAIANSE